MKVTSSFNNSSEPKFLSSYSLEETEAENEFSIQQLFPSRHIPGQNNHWFDLNAIKIDVFIHNMEYTDA